MPLETVDNCDGSIGVPRGGVRHEDANNDSDIDLAYS